MKRLLMLLLLSVPILRADESFGPVEPALFESATDAPYDAFLRATVFRHFGHRLPLAFCALPSFQPEWGVMAWPSKSGALHVTVCESPVVLWHAADIVPKEGESPAMLEQRRREVARDIKISEWEFDLPPDLGSRVLAAWQQVLFSAPAHHVDQGLDGTTFYYFAEDPQTERRAAMKQWTPSADSDAGRLAALAFTIKAYKPDIPATRDDLLRALEKAETRFESHPPIKHGSSDEPYLFLQTTRSGSEVLQLGRAELERQNKPIPTITPEVMLQSLNGRRRWLLTWPVTGTHEVMSVIIDDESGRTTYSGPL